MGEPLGEFEEVLLLAFGGVEPGLDEIDQHATDARIGGMWRMLRSSHAWTKSDAWAARFQVPVAADGAATLTYRVRVTY